MTTSRVVCLACLVLTSAIQGDVVAQIDTDSAATESSGGVAPLTKGRRRTTPLSIASKLIRKFWRNATIFDCGDDPGDGDGGDGDGGDGDSGSGGNNGPSSAFTITLDLKDVGDTNEFQSAVARWSEVIIGDLPDYTGNLGGKSSCGAWPSTVDDVYICAKYETIDGPGGVLGAASPRHYREDEGLPITGEMRFDKVDIEGISDLKGVILHEMGHVLGIGALWPYNQLTTGWELPCPYKSDSAASREFRALSGCSGAIPVETGIPGSNCGHWSESCFTNEVMTSAANNYLPVSRLTIAGLEDLGYKVDYSRADKYGVANLNTNCRCNNSVRRNLFSGHYNQSSVKGSERRLSQEGRLSAINYGQQILDETREQISLRPNSKVLDIGGDIIYVLYQENDAIFNVMVTPTM